MLLYPQHTGRRGLFRRRLLAGQNRFAAQWRLSAAALEPGRKAATDEELRAWLAADEQARNAQTKNLCLLDTAGGMTDTDMTWGGDAGNVQLVHNGAAYVLNESGLVTKFDLTAGTAQTRQLDLQGTQILYGVVEGARLDGWIPVTVLDDSEGLLNLRPASTPRCRPHGSRIRRWSAARLLWRPAIRCCL